MDRLASLRVFVKVVEVGGFSPAARALALSTSMVCKHVDALERHLGTTLLLRTTRRVVPTDTGQRLQAHAMDILRAVEEAERDIGAETQEPVGRLRVTAPVEFGTLHIAPLVNRLMRRHPGVAVSLELGNRVVDVVEEGFDCAVRIAPGLDSRLRGRPLTRSALLLVASPAYLRRAGRPRAPEELAQHATLSFSLSMGSEWPFERDGERRVVAVAPRLSSNSSEALRQAVLSGEGIALLPSFLVGEDLRAGRLARVLPSWSHGTLQVFVLYPARRCQPARLRAFIDLLVERFGPDCEREGFLSPA